MGGSGIHRRRRLPIDFQNDAGRLLLSVHVRLQEAPHRSLARRGVISVELHPRTHPRVHGPVTAQHRNFVVSGLLLAGPDGPGGTPRRASDRRLVGVVDGDHPLERNAERDHLHDQRYPGGLPPRPGRRHRRPEVFMDRHALHHGHERHHGGLLFAAIPEGQDPDIRHQRRRRHRAGENPGSRHAGRKLPESVGRQRDVGNFLRPGTAPHRYHPIVRAGAPAVDRGSRHLHLGLPRKPPRGVLVGCDLGRHRDRHRDVPGAGLGLGQVRRRRADPAGGRIERRRRRRRRGGGRRFGSARTGTRAFEPG
mmetsp:Transcript_1900/g.4981  ORF Transcript_1900/g.4981 Transcript_1900/m.4981 type:complete len:308 (-) Transcript_1900:279-1202(-)